MSSKKPSEFPEQQQKSQPGDQYKMNPEPEVIRTDYKGSDKLQGKTALITGGDSGIGRSIAVHFAREGADVAIVYLEEDKDAKTTQRLVEEENQNCLLLKGDIKNPEFCKDLVSQTYEKFGSLNILVHNAAVQYPKNDLESIDFDQVETTFHTNIFPQFMITKSALQHMGAGDVILCTTSVTTYKGSSHLVDYASTKGAIVGFTRSLAKMLAPQKIRVNGVAPGPIWPPLIPATFDHVSDFGQDTLLGRAGQPSEVAPAYVFLASKDGSYITGQIIHVNGGDFISS